MKTFRVDVTFKIESDQIDSATEALEDIRRQISACQHIKAVEILTPGGKSGLEGVEGDDSDELDAYDSETPALDKYIRRLPEPLRAYAKAFRDSDAEMTHYLTRTHGLTARQTSTIHSRIFELEAKKEAGKREAA